MHVDAIIARHRGRKRMWVPNPHGVQLLGRSARQLARSSASKLSQPSAVRCLRRLKALMAAERVCKLMIADHVVELIDGHGLRAIDIARETGWRPSDISQMHRTATAFPPAQRPNDVPYNHLLLATRMVRKFPILGMTAAQALAEICSAGLSQHRDVTRHFATLAREAAPRLMALPAEPQAHEPFDRTYHSRFQDLRGVFPDRSIQILHVDPVYVYARGLYGSRSARSLECDNADRESAIATVIDLLRRSLRAGAG
jgi:hypothetical protein